MGVLGEMFPGSKISDEAGEAGDGERWRLGPIDLDANTVVLHRSPAAGSEPTARDASDDDPTSTSPDPSSHG